MLINKHARTVHPCSQTCVTQKLLPDDSFEGDVYCPIFTLSQSQYHDQAWCLSVHGFTVHCKQKKQIWIPVDNFGTVVGENPTPCGILALWAVNSLSIVYWDSFTFVVSQFCSPCRGTGAMYKNICRRILICLSWFTAWLTSWRNGQA